MDGGLVLLVQRHLSKNNLQVTREMPKSTNRQTQNSLIWLWSLENTYGYKNVNRDLGWRLNWLSQWVS